MSQQGRWMSHEGVENLKKRLDYYKDLSGKERVDENKPQGKEAS